MDNAPYLERREQIETYFDRTAAQAWARLTSNAPVGRIRATVRAGREQMRNTLLGWLPSDMRGLRLLDAGSGTGALAMEAAQRGADVVAIDLSPTLVNLARERWTDTLKAPGAGRILFSAGDMLDDRFGSFDHVVAMDSLIHYDEHDMVRVIESWSQRTISASMPSPPSTPTTSPSRSMTSMAPRPRSPSPNMPAHRSRSPWAMWPAPSSRRRSAC